MRRGPLSVLATGALLVGAPAAEAIISPGVSIRGVRIGDSEADVKAKLGKLAARPASPGTKSYASSRYGLFVTLVKASDKKFRVTILSTTRLSKEATPQGIAAGATRAELRKAYPKIKDCSKPSSTVCVLPSTTTKNRFTTFLLAKGKVVSITVSAGRVAGG